MKTTKGANQAPSAEDTQEFVNSIYGRYEFSRFKDIHGKTFLEQIIDKVCDEDANAGIIIPEQTEAGATPKTRYDGYACIAKKVSDGMSPGTAHTKMENFCRNNPTSDSCYYYNIKMKEKEFHRQGASHSTIQKFDQLTGADDHAGIKDVKLKINELKGLTIRKLSPLR